MADTIPLKAVAVCRDGNRVLLDRGYNRTSGEHFCHPTGGRIEFWEWAADAVIRVDGGIWGSGLRIEAARRTGDKPHIGLQTYVPS